MDEGGWRVVEIGEGEGEGELDRRASAATSRRSNILSPVETSALYRRSSLFTPTRLVTETRLDGISPSFAPLTPDTLPASPVLKVALGLQVQCPFCLADLSGLMDEVRIYTPVHTPFPSFPPAQLTLCI